MGTIVTWVENVFIGVAILSIIFLTILYLLGYHPRIVLSGSMEPTLSKGSLSFIDIHESVDKMEEGDIIAFRLQSGQEVTHRITVKHQGYFITKGDANEIEDYAPVSYEQVIGKTAFWIPKVGNIILFFKTRRGIQVLLGVLLICVGTDLLLRRKGGTVHEV